MGDCCMIFYTVRHEHDTAYSSLSLLQNRVSTVRDSPRKRAAVPVYDYYVTVYLLVGR